jgi:hypothetical protein
MVVLVKIMTVKVLELVFLFYLEKFYVIMWSGPFK